MIIQNKFLRMGKFKYLLVFLLPLAVFVAFKNNGWWTFFPIFVSFGIVPILELFLEPDRANLEKEEKEAAKTDLFFDRLLYFAVATQIGFLLFFLIVIKETPEWSLEFFGRILSMGLMCGTFGINIGHELGHRSKRWHRILGEILLLTSMEMHFLLFHNGGHHNNVATRDDPATARVGEWVYTFWFRSQIGGYLQAWHMETKRLKKKGQQFMSFANRMMIYTLAEFALALGIYISLGWVVFLAFFLSACFGIILLETVNYIEHYGLLRSKTESGKYERVLPKHSWNSDHVLGRIFLFELSRHSDHHYKASKHYQILESLPDSPQMPTGYPGMMVLSLFAPIWVKFMNSKIK